MSGRAGGERARSALSVLPGRPRPEHVGLLAVMGLSAALVFVRLSQNGYANSYYSAAVRSMLGSLTRFVFVSADPNGLITVDKPPLGLWLQAASAKVFGLSPASLLIPEGVCAVLAVALIYRIIAPRFGAVAGLASALALAVFPSFVAVARDNGVDPLLILLMLAGAGAGLRAVDSGRLRWLTCAAVLIGLAFNTKALAAFLCVPGIVAAYLCYAPVPLRRRVAQLLAAGVVLAAVSVSWTAAVDLTPASDRPFVGSSTKNSELQLIFAYNGFGRVGGQQGGPGTTKDTLTRAQTVPLVRPGVNVPLSAATRAYFLSDPPPAAALVTLAKPISTSGRRHAPIPFGGARSPVRIFGTGLGDQGGWLVPFALIGLVCAAIVVRRARDRRRAATLLTFGGWMLVELLTLDFSSGIVHPYYVSALAPGVAAMVGAGAVAIGSLVRSDEPMRALIGFAVAVLAVAFTVAVQLMLIRREHSPLWWQVPLVLICVGGIAAIPFAARHSGLAFAAVVLALMVAPAVYSASVWDAPVYGVFPAAGPTSYAGTGGVGASPRTERALRGLIHYLRTHGATRPYALLTQSSDQAAPLILLGLEASAEGGYGASDPALGAGALSRLVAAGKARYLLIGGPYASRGGNGAATAARLVCPEVSQEFWGAGTSSIGSYLVDCAGREAELRHPYRTARAFLRAHPGVHYRLAPLSG